MTVKRPEGIELGLDLRVNCSSSVFSLVVLCKGRNSNGMVLALAPPRGDFFRNQPIRGSSVPSPHFITHHLR